MDFLNRIDLCGIVGHSNVTKCCDTKVCSFSLMTEYCHKGEDGSIVVETMWIQVTACGPKPGWPDLDNIKKGSKVHVTGRLRYRQYTDSNGFDHKCWDVVAQTIKLVDE